MFLPHVIARVFVLIRSQFNKPAKDRLQAAGENKLTDLRPNATNNADSGSVSLADVLRLTLSRFGSKRKIEE